MGAWRRAGEEGGGVWRGRGVGWQDDYLPVCQPEIFGLFLDWYVALGLYSNCALSAASNKSANFNLDKMILKFLGNVLLKKLEFLLLICRFVFFT
jgi:hypothetical protein